MFAAKIRSVRAMSWMKNLMYDPSSHNRTVSLLTLTIFSSFETQCLSCSQVLALFSEMAPAALESFDTVEADRRMEAALDELRLLVANRMA